MIIRMTGNKMDIRHILYVIAGLLLLWPAAGHAQMPEQGPVVGTVLLAHGTATIQHPHFESPVGLIENAPVRIGDKIFTGDNGHARIRFNDDSEIVMGAGGELTVNEFVFDPRKPEVKTTRFRILGAAFEYIGDIRKPGPESDVAIEIDFGTIGIRGTRLIRGMRDMNCWIYLEDGSITVETDGGRVLLEAGQGTRLGARDIEPEAPEYWDEARIGWIREELTPPGLPPKEPGTFTP